MVDIVFAKSRAALHSLRRALPDSWFFCVERNFAEGDIAADNDEPQELKELVLTGKPLRLWLSSKPEEMCGFYWLLHWLYKWQACGAEVSAVRTPWFEERPDGTVVIYEHWGEAVLKPEIWRHYAAQAQKLPANFILGAALEWQDLQKQNAPLRVMLDGHLFSVAADFYDNFVRLVD